MEYWSAGVLEYRGIRAVKILLLYLLYSITPILQYSRWGEAPIIDRSSSPSHRNLEISGISSNHPISYGEEQTFPPL
jgi:hypothetical protein